MKTPPEEIPECMIYIMLLQSYLFLQKFPSLVGRVKICRSVCFVYPQGCLDVTQFVYNTRLRNTVVQETVC